MLDQADKEWIENLLNQRFSTPLATTQSELNHYRRHFLSAEDARKIFRADTLRVNAWTRLSVAIVAALAVIGNGTSNVLVDHTESRAMAKYEAVTDRKLASYESRVAQNNQQLALEVRAAIVERNSHLEALIVKAGNK
jgi:hypothetical protein